MKPAAIKHLLYLPLVFLAACKKEQGATPQPPPPVDTTVVVNPPTDPPLAPTIGFFAADWQPKTFTPPAYVDTAIPTSATHTVSIDPSVVLTKVPRSIAGNNANLWMTQMITEAPLMTHITNLHPHIIRFPGGSISDVFFWNSNNNTPPADAPAQLVQSDGTKVAAGFWYGNNSDSWTFSVENYYRMLQQTGNEGMITINYGYARYGTGPNPAAAAAHLAADWVRYDNGRTRYWEIGNETYGAWEAGYRMDPAMNKDGQPEIVTGELYGAHFKIFADSMHKAAAEKGATIHIGALMVESEPQAWQTATVKTWNTGLLQKAGNSPDFYIVHNYYTPFQQNSTAGDILATAGTETKKMTDFVKSAWQGAGVAAKPLALTEWNIFAEGSMQQVSHINGMHGVLVVGEALKNNLGMTARWDLANGWASGNDHGMFNMGDEPGAAKWNPRPAFYHLYFFQKALGDRLVKSEAPANSNIASYASSFSSGQVGVTLVNKSAAAQTAQLSFKNFNAGTRFYWYTLTGGTDGGSFSRNVFVNGRGPAGPSGGPEGYASLKPYAASTAGGIRVSLPPYSVVCLVVDGK